MAYVFEAIAEAKFAIWARYMRPEAMAQMRRHGATRGAEWPALIARVHEQARRDPDGTSPASRALAGEWMALSNDMIGTDPADVAAFREATMKEPVLRMGSGIGGALMEWLPKAVGAAHQSAQ